MRRRPTIAVETLASPAAYTLEQIERACKIAATIGSSVFVLTEEPALCPRCFDRTETFCCECGSVAGD